VLLTAARRRLARLMLAPALLLVALAGSIGFPATLAYPQADSAEAGDVPLFQSGAGPGAGPTSGRAQAPTMAPLATSTAAARASSAAEATPTVTPSATPAARMGAPNPTRSAITLAASAASSPGGRPESDDRGPRYAGWATEAYPQDSVDKMEEMVARQRAAGANIVWLGHNNPGEVNAQGPEPGLSYAIYEALQDENDPRNAC
jgi:hypothetical protein